MGFFYVYVLMEIQILRISFTTFNVFNLCAYIIATADGHAGMARCDLFSLAGSRQVIIKPAAGIITGDGRELIQRQIHVLQTAKHTKKTNYTLTGIHMTHIHKKLLYY